MPCITPRNAVHATRSACVTSASYSGKCPGGLQGPVCKQLLVLLDADCNTVQKLLVPGPVRALLIRTTQKHLQEFARSAFADDNVQVKLVGSAGAGTHLPDTSPLFFVAATL